MKSNDSLPCASRLALRVSVRSWPSIHGMLCVQVPSILRAIWASLLVEVQAASNKPTANKGTMSLISMCRCAERPNISDPARGTRGLQPGRGGRVRCSASFDGACMWVFRRCRTAEQNNRPTAKTATNPTIATTPGALTGIRCARLRQMRSVLRRYVATGPYC